MTRPLTFEEYPISYENLIAYLTALTDHGELRITPAMYYNAVEGIPNPTIHIKSDENDNVTIRVISRPDLLPGITYFQEGVVGGEEISEEDKA